jgi:hypothetical protein
VRHWQLVWLTHTISLLVGALPQGEKTEQAIPAPAASNIVDIDAPVSVSAGGNIRTSRDCRGAHQVERDAVSAASAAPSASTSGQLTISLAFMAPASLLPSEGTPVPAMGSARTAAPSYRSRNPMSWSGVRPATGQTATDRRRRVACDVFLRYTPHASCILPSGNQTRQQRAGERAADSYRPLACNCTALMEE